MSLTIENPVSRDLTPLELIPAIDHITNVYRQIFGPRLQAVYLLGSSVNGLYEPGHSDLDVKAIVQDRVEEDINKVSQLERGLQGEFNIAKFELAVYDLANLNERGWLQFYVLVDGVCIWGKPYEPTLPLPTTRGELANMLAAYILEKYDKVYEVLDKLKSQKEDANPQYWGSICAKKAIRLANTIVIQKTGLYTQHFKTIIERIVQNVPEISEAISILSCYKNNSPLDVEGFIRLTQASETVRRAALKRFNYQAPFGTAQ